MNKLNISNSVIIHSKKVIIHVKLHVIKHNIPLCLSFRPTAGDIESVKSASEN